MNANMTGTAEVNKGGWFVCLPAGTTMDESSQDDMEDARTGGWR